MKYNITARRMKRDPKWVKGTIGHYTYEAMVFNEGSHYGIDHGRVSKLWIWDDWERKSTGDNFNDIVVYDRGWERMPQAEHKVLFDALLAYLGAMPPYELN